MSLSWSAEILSGRSWAEAEARRQAAARASTEAMVMAEREVLLSAARDVLLGAVLPPPLLPTVWREMELSRSGPLTSTSPAQGRNQQHGAQGTFYTGIFSHLPTIKFSLVFTIIYEASRLRTTWCCQQCWKMDVRMTRMTWMNDPNDPNDRKLCRQLTIWYISIQMSPQWIFPCTPLQLREPARCPASRCSPVPGCDVVMDMTWQ